jgi:hypothetical protein
VRVLVLRLSPQRSRGPRATIIAGYYDSNNATVAAQQELQAPYGVPGVDGFMYTTWNDDYSQLAQFADTVRAGSRQCAASISK